MAYDRSGKKQQWQPRPRAKSELTKPRRVRSGVKLTLSDEQLSESWAASRWRRLIEQVANGDAMREGVDYARLGQTRSVEVEPGNYIGFVQGRADKPYRTHLGLTTLNEHQWEAVLDAMSDQAVYAAKLLAGELPSNIEDLFAPLGVRLFPTDPAEITVSCSCKEEIRPWCKHAVCLAQILAQHLANDPFLIFTMRGLPGEELIERLRQRRSLSGVVGLAPVYVQRPAEIAEIQTTPIEELTEQFWHLGPGVEQLQTPIEPSEVSRPLLRRLGPSPFSESRFPLVGLLATCYELISGAVIASEDPDAALDPASSHDTDDDPAGPPAALPEPTPDSPPAEPHRAQPSGPPAMPKAMPKARKATPKQD